jgi:toxin CptA
MTGFTDPIRLRPRASARLAIGLVVTHAGAAAIAALLAWPIWARVLLVIFVSSSLLWSLAWHVLHRGDAAMEAVLQADGSWILETGQVEARPATLAADSLVTPQLTVLVFRLADGRRRSLLLLPDNIDPDSFRRLRVRLRFPLRG